MFNIVTLSAAAFLALAPAAFAQSGSDVNSAGPARASDGGQMQAPASGRSMSRDSGMGVQPGSGNPDHANGGNGPGGRY